MKKEIWKDAYNLKYYKVSNFGNVRSVTRKGAKGGLIKPNPCYGDYLCFSTCENGKRSYKKVHIAVWEAFNGPIPEGYDIHHKNHNRQDNRLDNLELVESHQHNKMHNEEKSKQVAQYDFDGNLIKIYPSIAEAERLTGVGSSHISSCCKGGKYKSAGGSVWRYVA